MVCDLISWQPWHFLFDSTGNSPFHWYEDLTTKSFVFAFLTGRLLSRSESSPVPSCGSEFAYMIPPENITTDPSHTCASSSRFHYWSENFIPVPFRPLGGTRRFPKSTPTWRPQPCHPVGRGMKRKSMRFFMNAIWDKVITAWNWRECSNANTQ